MKIDEFRMNDADPSKFYALVDVLKSVTPEQLKELQGIRRQLEDVLLDINDRHKVLARTSGTLMHEKRATTKFNRIAGLADPEVDLSGLAGFGTFDVMYSATELIRSCYSHFGDLVSKLRPRSLFLSKKDQEVGSYDDLRHLMYELQINTPAVQAFLSSLLVVDETDVVMFEALKRVGVAFEDYYRMLTHRHTTEGIEIQQHPVITDIAMAVYANIDSHGEIAEGTKPNEISIYSRNKAVTLAKLVKDPEIFSLLKAPNAFISKLLADLMSLWDLGKVLRNLFDKQIRELDALSGFSRDAREARHVSDEEFNTLINEMQALNPADIVFREKSVLLSREERFNLKFRNETIRSIVALLTSPYVGVDNLVDYVLNRKDELRRYFQEENSFYVCKIGAGNSFMGEAPGALSVIPGQRPLVDLDDIIGSGFDEVKGFISIIESANKWHDLFIATSPSKTADKSNVLLVGPAGCGKTQVLRAVGSDKHSIGVFAQGSDFLTCWMGEAQKNPKRLFEEGLKLSRDANRHVHFLIDEIDSVLNNDHERNVTNLTLEFQILMDGVVQYPNLSVWGTTNNPRRIPMPMIRRFSKVLIVGEMNEAQRVKLLKLYVGRYLPTLGVMDQAWEDVAKKLGGATGDVVRKVADHLWREKMSAFVQAHPEQAEQLVKYLNKKEKFQIASFDNVQREQFKVKLAEWVSVTGDDLARTVDLHLENIAIRAEIDTAVKTYQNAKEFLVQLR